MAHVHMIPACESLAPETHPVHSTKPRSDGYDRAPTKR
ncbi:hypothetical protein BSIN_3726 [Burkholderia singularis]|uniref:Uncharacterized protein n=1 Tax=Burkholderia singularis TaxID=1503053 RepID=A0A238H6B7_9BURK|nr:hypothetical protein BSIN_3726 [Burkholderia singularis]